ncbi:TetR/AcrR family transcriptional regulator [Paenibacillus sp. 1011MAR3C5]|uniref:TetR/AcrR family transcriptional regulator n=1 Tax=Paenibacillus sp. 1011MAR3C5 TaxID=1675787 RepID=UPI000E6C063B|nr:TetR/AcrR family transcriptional regulator [Paenibacillus sp. 1011MAR3C5]RJE88426.1 TetR/AcrR family transcriptional regulator [Paenibacillus sp. 1011MAR3C5]
MNGFERRRNGKIEQIFQAANLLFSQHGYQNVSVNEVAEQAGVSPATIYNYFGTKEKLAAAMLRYWMDKQLDRYRDILASEETFLEKTKHIMTLEARNVKGLTEELKQASSAERAGLALDMERYAEEQLADFFRQYVEIGKQEGYIRKEQSDEGMAMYFAMYQNELARLWAEQQGRDMGAYIDQLVGMFFYGLVGKRA